MNTLIAVAGIGLATTALVALVALTAHSVRTRRGWFGRRGASRVFVRAVCVIVLIAGFVASAEGLPVVSRTSVSSAVETGGAVEAEATSTSWQMPFYAHATVRHSTFEGTELGGSVTRTLTLPWPFLVVVALYLILSRALRKPSEVGH